MSRQLHSAHFNVHIFVIDDEEVTCEFIRLFLRNAGYKNIHAFTSPVEAMDVLSLVKADLVFTDVHMPELGGKFLAKLIRKSGHLRQVPIIAVTADSSEETRDKLIGNGVSDILIKPFQGDELLRITKLQVEAHLERMTDPTIPRATANCPAARKERDLRKAFDRI